MLIDRPGRYYQLVAGIPSLYQVGGRCAKFIPRWWLVYKVYTLVVACIPSLLLPYPFIISTTEQSSLPSVIVVIFFGLFVSPNSNYTINSCAHLTWLANKFPCILAEVQLCEKCSLCVQDSNLKRLDSWQTDCRLMFLFYVWWLGIQFAKCKMHVEYGNLIIIFALSAKVLLNMSALYF